MSHSRYKREILESNTPTEEEKARGIVFAQRPRITRDSKGNIVRRGQTMVTGANAAKRARAVAIEALMEQLGMTRRQAERFYNQERKKYVQGKT